MFNEYAGRNGKGKRIVKNKNKRFTKALEKQTKCRRTYCENRGI